MADNYINSDSSFDSSQGDSEDEIDLGELLVTLFESKWLIISITIIALMIGISKAFLDTPIYKADAMLQVEESSSSSLGALEGVSGLFESKVPVQAEIEIIKSRMIIGKAVNNLNLDVSAKPKFFPIIGKAIARKYKLNHKDKISDPWFGYSDYAWGGELIKVESLIVPESWLGKKLILISGESGLFTLKNGDKLTIQGNVGKIIYKDIEDEGGVLSLYVSALNARPGTHFVLIRQAKTEAVSSLQKNISVSEKGKRTGILSLTLESAFPSLASDILNEIANIYVQFNVEQKSEEAQKTLEFLDRQLPQIKKQLEVATADLNEYRLQKGSIDLTLETQGVLTGVVEKGTQITLLQQKRDELRRNFTSLHPTVVAIDKQIRRLQVQMDKQNEKISELPETQQVILRLARDVQVNTELYTTLLNNSQTLKVAKAGTVGDVRVIDYAERPTQPIKPKKILIVAISFILGLILAIAWVFIRKALNHGIEDPDLLEQQLNVPVYATVPHSPLQKILNTKLKKDKQFKNRTAVLAVENDEDMAIESLRSLRTTLHFAFLEAKNNIVMITGPSPSIGKSFVSTNLAVVLARSGKKVLLIDADMRKGLLNKALDVTRDNGLSDLISNKIDSSEAIRNIKDCDIDFIPTGSIPPNPSELLLHERFTTLLEGFSSQYDHIIIDSPPILAVTDACIIGRMASATLMVVKSGEHSLRELKQCVKRLNQNNVNTKGIIFNDIPVSSSRYGGYGYGKYVYQYSYEK